MVKRGKFNRYLGPTRKPRRFSFLLLIAVLILIFVIISLASSVFDAVTDKILVVPVEGVISSSSTEYLFFSQEGNVPFILGCLEKAEKDSTIKAVLLDINSPGGTVIGSSNVADQVVKVKQKKPVVAFINEIGASGGYWIASTADYIVAEPFSFTGSIGVTASYLQYAGLMSNFNVTYERLVTGEFKDLGSPYKELTSRERKVLMDKLMMIHEEFSRIVAENRGLTPAQIREVNNGLFFLGKEAYELGLVDELGNMDKATQVTREKAGYDKLKVTTCKKSEFFWPFFKVSANFAYFMGKGIGSELTPSYSSADFLKAFS